MSDQELKPDAASFRALCPSCGKGVKISPHLVGKRARCLRCQHEFVVSSAEVLGSNQPLPSVQAETASLLDCESTESGAETKQTLKTVEGTIGRFQLQEIVGRGGFGVVYRATDTHLGRQVALKVPTFAHADPKRIRRFVKEAKIAAKLKHPSIVGVFDSGITDKGEYYIATEFIEGATLEVFVRRHPINLKTRVQWIRDLADALVYAHKEGVIHRDIKPSNILIDSHAQSPKLADFGLAKQLDEETSIQTQDGALLGTPAYMSPEQARGVAAEVGPLSDQYSLGCVLYELLTGRRPYTGTTVSVIQSITSDGSPVDPRTIVSEVPQDLAAICMKAMEKLPTRRYEGMQEFRNDLDRFLHGQSTLARPLPLHSRWLRKIRQHSVISSLIVALLIMTGFAAWGVLSQVNPNPESSVVQDTTPETVPPVEPIQPTVGSTADPNDEPPPRTVSMVAQTTPESAANAAEIAPTAASTVAMTLTPDSPAQPVDGQENPEDTQALKLIEQLLDRAVSSRDLAGMDIVEEALRAHSQGSAQKDQLRSRLEVARQLFNRQEEQAKALIQKILARIAKGDELGAFLLHRKTPPEIKQTDTWTQRSAELVKAADPMKFPLEDRGNYYFLPPTAFKPDEPDEFKKTTAGCDYAWIMVYLEDESLETNCVAACKFPWCINSSLKVTSSVIHKSGDRLLVCHWSFNARTVPYPEVTLASLNHRRVYLDQQAAIITTQGYCGAVILKPADVDQLGTLNIELALEPGPELSDNDRKAEVAIGFSDHELIRIPVALQSDVTRLKSVQLPIGNYTLKYTLGNSLEIPPYQFSNGNLESEVLITKNQGDVQSKQVRVSRRRAITLDYKCRSDVGDPIVAGTTTVLRGTSCSPFAESFLPARRVSLDFGVGTVSNVDPFLMQTVLSIPESSTRKVASEVWDNDDASWKHATRSSEGFSDVQVGDVFAFWKNGTANSQYQGLLRIREIDFPTDTAPVNTN